MKAALKAIAIGALAGRFRIPVPERVTVDLTRQIKEEQEIEAGFTSIDAEPSSASSSSTGEGRKKKPFVPKVFD